MHKLTIDLTDEEHAIVAQTAAREGTTPEALARSRLLLKSADELRVLLDERMDAYTRTGGIAIPEGGLSDYLDRRTEDRGR